MDRLQPEGEHSVNDQPNTMSDFVPEEEDGRIGCRVGNLEIVRRLGVGGMGAVYETTHRVLKWTIPHHFLGNLS